MNQALQITPEFCDPHVGYVAFKLGGTIDEFGMKKDYATLFLWREARTMVYYPIGKPQTAPCALHDGFDCDSVNTIMDSLMMFHQDYLKTHGITIEGYDLSPVAYIELPPDVL